MCASPGPLEGFSPEGSGLWLCQSDRMAGRIGLHAERNALETQLLDLERAIEERQQCGMAAPELADRVTGLLDRLGQINAKLAERRGPGAPT